MAIAETLFTVCLPAGLKLYHTCLSLGFVSILFLPGGWSIWATRTSLLDLWLPGRSHQQTSRWWKERFRCLFQNPLTGYHRSTVSLYQSPSSCPTILSTQLTLPRRAVTAPSPLLQGRRGDCHSSLQFPYTLPMPFIQSSFIQFKLAIYLLLGPWQIKEIYIISNVVPKGRLYYCLHITWFWICLVQTCMKKQ